MQAEKKFVRIFMLYTHQPMSLGW